MLPKSALPGFLRPNTILLGFVLLRLQMSICLRDMELKLPPAVTLGETVTLSCQYHLQGERLYTIKLYKGRHEFLQLVPDKDPPLKTFPLKGVNVQNVSLNGSGWSVRGLTLSLTNVNLFTSGLYGCEASAEGSFHTELVRRHMTVIVKPLSRPVVLGFKSSYKVSDMLDMSCVVKDTFPAANITWFITGEKISDPSSVTSSVSSSPLTRLLTSHSRLKLPLRKKNFRDGQLSARCVGSLLTMHWQSAIVRVREEKPETLAAAAADSMTAATVNFEVMAGSSGGSKVAGVMRKTLLSKGSYPDVSSSCILTIVVLNLWSS